MARLLALFASVSGALARVGVDVSSAVSTETWQCLMRPGGQGPIEFAIPRVYRSSGSVDPNGAQTIKNARAAGIKYVDGYIFPCAPCNATKGAGAQVREAVEHLQDEGAEFGMLWYDIERYHWSDDRAQNRAFVQEMVDTGISLGIHAGIYAGYNSWSAIVGADWDYPHSKGLPLWYAHYDGNQDFSDFATTEKGGYGGWATPNIKQFYGDKTSCGAGIDYNWYPDSTGLVVV